MLALNCLLTMEQGGNVSLPCDAPACLEALAERYGCRVLHYVSCPADTSDARARRLAANQLWVRDGLMMAVRLLSAMKRSGRTLAELVEKLPGFATASRVIPCQGNPGKVLAPAGADRTGARGRGRPGAYQKRRGFRASCQAGGAVWC